MTFRSQIRFIGGYSSPFAMVVPHQINIETNHTQFITGESESLQLGLISRATGFKFPPHIHNETLREVSETREVLIVRKGVCKLTIYDVCGSVIDHVILSPGDVAMLIHGGHSIEVIEDLEILEIKQGPYLGLKDKRLIETVDE